MPPNEHPSLIPETSIRSLLVGWVCACSEPLGALLYSPGARAVRGRSCREAGGTVVRNLESVSMPGHYLLARQSWPTYPSVLPCLTRENRARTIVR